MDQAIALALGPFSYLVMIPIWIVIIFFALKYTIRLHKFRKKAGCNPWISTILITVMTFFIVTWDWLPSEIYYAYQCHNLPPMQVYKTPEQWLAENQDLINGKEVKFKINTYEDLPKNLEGGYKLIYSSNIINNDTLINKNTLFIRAIYKNREWDFYRNDLFLRTYSTKEALFDRRTGKLLMSDTSFTKVMRFFAPPEAAGSKTCGTKNNFNYIAEFMKLMEI